MAILKVEQVKGQVNTGNVPRASGLALPLSLANQQAQGFKAFADGVTTLYAAQKKEEDLNEAQSIADELSIDLIKKYNKYKSGSNLDIALKGFNDEVSYEKNFKDLGSNKRVKKEVRKYVNDFQRKYSLDLLGKVTENHQSITKARKTQTLNQMVIDQVAGGKNGLLAKKQYNNFWSDPLNLEYYGAEQLEKLKQEKDLEIIELSLIEGGNRGQVNLLNNEQRKEITEALPLKSQKAVINKIRNGDISRTIKSEEDIIFAEKKDKQFKIETFTTALLAINDARLNATNENISRNPSLDDLYDLRQSGAINSSQYDQLLRFKANDKTLDDPAILQIVNASFALADSVEKIDSLQEDVNLNKDIMQGLTPKSIIKYNQLAEKYKKDTTFGTEDKKFRELLDIGSKRILKSNTKGLNLFQNAQSANYDYLVKAEARVNEYDDLTLNKNFTPEQAYAEVIKKLGKDELPELQDLEQPKSISINNFKKNFEAHPKDAFNDLRKAVALAFKDNKDIETYKDDLRKIDVMEDTYDTRLIIMKDEDLALGKEFLPKKVKK
jgi:hypothetical protein